jgi:hypothetical protein
MTIKNLLCCAGAIWITTAGCATRPAQQEPVMPGATAQNNALGILARDLRAAYPPLSSYFVLPVEAASLKVFASIDKHGYSCRVFTLTKGQSHAGQVAGGFQYSAPTLTDVQYTKDHNIKVPFSEVEKIQTRPCPPPPGASADFPAYTDVTLLDRRGATIDTITAGTASAGEIETALLALCPNAKPDAVTPN